MRNQIALVLLLLPTTAHGAGTGSTSLLWDPADSYTDGSFMVLANQRIYAARDANVLCGVPPDIGSFVLVASVDAGVASYVYSGQFNGSWYFFATSIDVFERERPFQYRLQLDQHHR